MEAKFPNGAVLDCIIIQQAAQLFRVEYWGNLPYAPSVR